MSYEIFAAGSTATGGPFRVSRSGLDIGDVYEAVEAFSAMAMTSVTTRVAQAGVGAAAESVVSDQVVQRTSVTSPHQHGMAALGRLQAAELLREGLMHAIARCAPLNLFIAVRGESGLLTGTPTGTVRMRFQGNEHAPAADLFRSLNPVLERCNMNCFGVLSAIGRVIGDYSLAGGADVHGEYRLNIDVTAT